MVYGIEVFTCSISRFIFIVDFLLLDIKPDNVLIVSTNIARGTVAKLTGVNYFTAIFN